MVTVQSGLEALRPPLLSNCFLYARYIPPQADEARRAS